MKWVFFLLFFLQGTVGVSSDHLCRSILEARPPLLHQETDYTCGPAVVLSFLRWKNVGAYSEEALRGLLNTCPQTGTRAQEILSFFKSHNIAAKFKDSLSFESLVGGLSKGQSFILNVQSEGEGHWVLAFAYEEGHIVIMDPWLANFGYRKITKEELYSIWWGEEGVRAGIRLDSKYDDSSR